MSSLYVKSYPFEKCEAISGTLFPGKYKFEAWGASAGYSLGGYASGIVQLRYKIPFFIHIGSSPKEGNPSNGGCNGGGEGSSSRSDYNKIYGGGGATDIRFFKDTLYHRVLVAGGAGGCLSARNACGGRSPSCDAEPTSFPNPQYGTFGYGGNSSLESGGGYGGGGGWIGGESLSLTNEEGTISCGNGGTSYVLTFGSEIYEGYQLSTKYSIFFQSLTIISGDSSFPSIFEGKNETGHEGHGNFKITSLSYILNICTKSCFNINSIILLTLITLICK